LGKCLQFNPQKRISCEEALEHPYLSEFHVPEEEFTCGRTIALSIDDNQEYSLSDFRNQVWEDILLKKKELRHFKRGCMTKGAIRNLPSSAEDKKRGKAPS